MNLPIYRVRIEGVEDKSTCWPSTGVTEAAESYLENYLNKHLYEIDKTFTVIVEIDGRIHKFLGAIKMTPKVVVQLI